jgi:hypothetical protein
MCPHCMCSVHRVHMLTNCTSDALLHAQIVSGINPASHAGLIHSCYLYSVLCSEQPQPWSTMRCPPGATHSDPFSETLRRKFLDFLCCCDLV